MDKNKRVKLIKKFSIRCSEGGEEERIVLAKDITLYHNPSQNLTLIFPDNQKFFIEKLSLDVFTGQWWAYDSYQVPYYAHKKLNRSIREHLRTGWYTLIPFQYP